MGSSLFKPFSAPRNIAALSLVAFAMGGCSGRSAPGTIPVAAVGAPAPAPGTKVAVTSKIEHVIIVLLENRSTDNVFHFYDHSKADIADSGLDHNNNVVMLQPRSFTEPTDAGHDHIDFVKTFNNGANNGWDTNSQSTDRLYQYGYLPKGEVQPYLDIANQFAMSDRFFHGITAPTFPSHVEIGASTTFGVFGNPSVSIPWGCDAAAGTTTVSLDASGAEVPGPFPCFTGQSIFDLFDRKGVTWRYYDEPEGASITGNLVIPAAFRPLRFGLDWNTNIAKSDKEINTALSAGTLPQVSYVIPDATSTDHAATPSAGPTYIANLVNAFGASRYYNNSVMIVTWDDWGGWYDHVVPKKRPDGSQLSYRKPILFVGGYVKRGYVTHVETEDASINRSLEEWFGLGSLGQHDVFTTTFDDVFDFSKPPAPLVPINPTMIVTPTNATPVLVPIPSKIMGKLRSTAD